MDDCPRETVELWEDFTRDNVTGLNEIAVDSGDQDIATTAKHGGWWQQTLPGAGNDALLIAGELAFEADEGSPVIFETRLQMSSVTDFAVCVGMTDDCRQASGILVEDEGGTLEYDPEDCYCFMVEGDQSSGYWQAVSSVNDVDSTQVSLTLGAAVAASTTQTLRLEANPNDSGTVYYFIDGALVSTRTSWFRSSVVMCPALTSDDRDTASDVLYDYLYARAPRS